MHDLTQLQQAARTALIDCLGTKKGEQVLVVVDEPMVQLGEVFYQEGRRLGFEIMLVKMASRENHGTEPPGAIGAAMEAAQVVFCITAKSLSHTQARRNACARGARVASMPAVNAKMMQRALAVDYQQMAALSNKVAQLLTAGQKVHITTDLGTDLELDLTGRVGEADTGLLLNQGDFGNLPAGEAYIAPLEGRAQGTLVIDGAMSGVGVLAEPLVLQVEQGMVTELKGKDKDKLEAIFAKYGREARQIAELGIGTNPKAVLTGNVLEDEKVLGTIHIALGNNSNFGGQIQVPSHLDGIVTKPTVTIDGQPLLRNGQLLVEGQ